MEQLYFAKELIQKAKGIFTHAFSALEAPAGYGKTTLVHRLLDDSEEPVFWYTAVQSMPDASFRWFVRQISAFDEEAAGKLSDLGYLNRSNARDAAQIISAIRVEESVTLVFDNFQYALQNWYPQVIDSLAKRSNDGLRIIFISQNFGQLRTVIRQLESSICFLNARDLLLSVNDIKEYAVQMGVEASAEDIRTIMDRTDGWAAAVALCLKNCGESNCFSESADMDDLLYSLFWTRLSETQQEGLLSVCLFDRISDKQITGLVPEKKSLRKEVELILKRAPLVRFYEAKKEYYPHELLLQFLRTRLEEKEEGFRKIVYRNSGLAYQNINMTREAVECFYLAGDFESLLNCPLVCLLTEKFGNASYAQVAKDVLSGTPEEICMKYPLSLLRLCYALYAGCEFAEFERQMKKIRLWFEKEDSPHLLGEWHLLYTLSDFPQIPKMKESLLKAEKLMDHPSELFTKEEPFLFGCTSMWYLFYAKPGTMMETADLFDDYMRLYNRLTNDHGAGAAEIYRGEAYSVQGKFEESDILAYQAAFLSEQAENSSATYGAALLLGINAIYRSDMIGLQKAIDYLEKKARGYSFLQGRMLNNYMVETVRGYLLGLLMETGRSALWTQGEADTLSDLTFTTFMTKTCRITDLLLKKEYKRAIASVESSLGLDERLISASTRNFMYCGLALCYLAIGKIFKAAENLDKSLSIAGQDQNYTFLACFRKYFQPLFLMPSVSSRHAQTIKEIKELNIRYTRADESHIFSMLEDVPEYQEKLTQREREVAELAAAGYRNSEIASQLFISENTVKHHLKIAFQKMNIDRRSKLIEMLK